MINASVRFAAGRFRAAKSKSFPGTAGGPNWVVPPRIVVGVPTSGCILEIRLLPTGPASIGREFSARNRNANRTPSVRTSKLHRPDHERLDLHSRRLLAAPRGGRNKTPCAAADKTPQSDPPGKARAAHPETGRPAAAAAASFLSLNWDAHRRRDRVVSHRETHRSAEFRSISSLGFPG